MYCLTFAHSVCITKKTAVLRSFEGRSGYFTGHFGLLQCWKQWQDDGLGT